MGRERKRGIGTIIGEVKRAQLRGLEKGGKGEREKDGLVLGKGREDGLELGKGGTEEREEYVLVLGKERKRERKRGR